MFTFQNYPQPQSDIGGGILLFVRNGLTIFNVDVNKFNSNQYCKFSILSDNGEGNLNHQISELCKILREHDKSCIIIGDFNFPGINWTNQSSVIKAKNSLMKQFLPVYIKLYISPPILRGIF